MDNYYGYYMMMKKMKFPNLIECNIYEGLFARFYDDACKDDLLDIPLYITSAQNYGNKILELAAGTGRVAIPLATEGFQVTALDISHDMLEILKSKSKESKCEVEVVCENMLSYKTNRKYDVVIIAYGSILLLESIDDIKELLRCVRDKYLSNNGVFIFNIIEYNTNASANHFINEESRYFIMYQQKKVNNNHLLVNMYGEEVIDEKITNKYLAYGLKLNIDKAYMKKLLEEYKLDIIYEKNSSTDIGDITYFVAKNSLLQMK